MRIEGGPGVADPLVLGISPGHWERRGAQLNKASQEGLPLQRGAR